MQSWVDVAISILQIYVMIWDRVYYVFEPILVFLPILTRYVFLSMLAGVIYIAADHLTEHKLKSFMLKVIYALLMISFILWRVAIVGYLISSGEGTLNSIGYSTMILVFLGITIALTVVRGFYQRFGSLLQLGIFFLTIVLGVFFESWQVTLEAASIIVFILILWLVGPMKSIFGGKGGGDSK